MLFTRRSPASEAERHQTDRVLSRGEKTVIREFERRDVDRWMAWPRHQNLLFESYNAPLLTLRQREMYFQQRHHSPDSRQYACDDLAGDLVGRISLREIDWRLGASVLGISFHPQRLNQGLGTDALWAFLAYYFGPLRMNALFLDVAAFNQRAFRVYEKCGFRKCSQRWGEPQADVAGVFRKPEYEEIRHLFQWDYGLIRPLLMDMVLRRDEWLRRRDERMPPAR
jgi:RimJ/RimL family protein N-acetyltransferase